MNRRTIIILLAILLFLIFVGPLFETVDHWDNIPKTGNGTVLTLVLVVSWIGAISLFKKCAAAALELIARIKLSERRPEGLSVFEGTTEPVPLESPPLSLLTSLRI
ncbi:MAG: hypothetical protein M3Y27_16030 [Acidobacteriota bacterium]|nr:hypothetical protein [Acidobacteriota bacterium]